MHLSPGRGDRHGEGVLSFSFYFSLLTPEPFIVFSVPCLAEEGEWQSGFGGYQNHLGRSVLVAESWRIQGQAAG